MFDVSTLVGMTKYNFYIIQVLESKQLKSIFFFFLKGCFLILNITFVRLQDNTSFEKDGFHI